MSRIQKALLRCLCLSLLALPTSAGAQSDNVEIPNTPAGHVLRTWLDVSNGADTARMAAYFNRYRPDVTPNLSTEQAFAKRTGGFQLLSVERSEPRHIEFLVKERNSAMTAYGIIELGAGSGDRVTGFPLWALGDNAPASGIRIDATARSRAVAGVLAVLDSAYVTPDVEKRMSDSVRARLARGAYDVETNGIALALRLSDDLRDISHDKHLRVDYRVTMAPPAPGAGPAPRPSPSPSPVPSPTSAPSPQMIAQRRQQQADDINCGFQRAERLDGNVGYLKFDGFAPPEVCASTASAAMSFLAGTSSLIIDLRDNTGGSPDMVTYIASYLFSQRTHVNDLWMRPTGATAEFWTSDTLSGRRFGGTKPVFVLTSSRTFSGGEEFAYDLQSLKRATIVGETTGGGAHPVALRVVDQHFLVGVPFAKAVNPITHTDWEGTGVVPDVKVPAAEALTRALELARNKGGH